jgi:proteasome lid subunit RPN8/RPN11
MEYSVRFKSTEVFGLLLGDVFRTSSAKLRTVVRDFIPAQRLRASTSTFVEVSAEELIRMDHAFEESPHTRELLKIGWFHTHPGHGIFMSGTDKENHQMYQKPWQIALVVDPIHGTSGFFFGNRCEAIPAIGLSASAARGAVSPTAPSASPSPLPLGPSAAEDLRPEARGYAQSRDREGGVAGKGTAQRPSNLTLLIAIAALSLTEVLALSASALAYSRANAAQRRLVAIEKRLNLLKAEVEAVKSESGREGAGKEPKRE